MKLRVCVEPAYACAPKHEKSIYLLSFDLEHIFEFLKLVGLNG